MTEKSLYKLFCFLLISSCATFKPQYDTTIVKTNFPNKEISHSFYLIGDGGNSPLGTSSKTLQVFKKELSKASKNSTAIFLGDNIYPKGLPSKDHKEREFAEHQLNMQTQTTADFKGNTIFVPGNHDWYSDGLKGLKRQEKFIEKALGKDTFLPENGCPIEKVHVSNDVELILIDTQWFVTNWNNHPTINDDCEIKTRELFFNEYSSLIKKARGKTTIVALHHPMYTNGLHGGQYSFKSHMSPIPVLGSLKNLLRITTGVSNADIQNKRYNELRKRLVTISQENSKIIFVSGHEHNLQYLVQDNMRQIVSGSGSKVTPTRNVGGGQFSYGTPGYARLDVFNDGSSYVRFYSVEEDKIVFETQVLKPDVNTIDTIYPETFPKEKTASIYTEEETDKSVFTKFLWGERYRDTYSTKVTAPTVNLDTLFGGVTVGRRGGGTQSKSLRLITKDGKKQYVMRAVRKQGTQYLQAAFFKDQYLDGNFDDTAAEDLILDVFTGSHPYALLTVGDLSDAIGVYHLNPKLYYVPKQNALGDFNAQFGDELYMIEEHASDGHGDQASFGFSNTVLSTSDVMAMLHKDEDLVMDEAAYIRARLFDMLIGDWDRHQDQWRWLEFKENGKKIYRPLPRDRDQVFSIMSDGALLTSAVTVLPMARLLRKYDDDLVDVKGVNVEPYPLDMEFIVQSDKAVWNAQVKTIQEGITDEVIDKAFLNIPEEVRGAVTDKIKQTLKARRANLQKIADRYFNLVNKYAVLKGTNKDDWFDIERLPNGKTKVTAYRIKGGEKADVFHECIYDNKQTKEVWIYGLDDDDTFHVYGNDTKNQMRVRLIGGQNHDVYNIEQGKKITFYDYKSKESTILTKNGHQKFTNDYETNVYDYKKLKNNVNELLPTIGSNPDDGLKIGLSNTYTVYGFERNPFTAQHTVSAAYYFATNGFELNYNGEFANVFKGLNFGLDMHFNSPNYAINFFDYGNSTPNFEADDIVNMDYNRVKIRSFGIQPALIWRGQLGGYFKAGILYESNEVERTNGRFINQFIGEGNEVSDSFYGADATYSFENKDNEAFPTLGMQFGLQIGFKNNVDSGKGFGYIIPELGFDYKLIPSGKLVLATNFSGHFNLGNNFEFYQAATLGANTGLRGYRNERFTGKSALVQSTDLRLQFLSLKTKLIPISLGVYGGADYGRIWVDNDLVSNTTYNNDRWNTSFGGGVFVTMIDMFTANVSAFNSDDGTRVAFKLGFGF
ncbi:metallophosphoesterase [Oceanihabitans sp. 2_MG-2023]|uniref:metallophosphoesterase n=1 Tax=Oceanihabitans sp. 2_MG-2023 TaxID=3062661 RepID=UPI0026E323C9|nr:metallophosphoesterase [Oceanihabitans sp. 2_MG-2023]MDO6596702.1 metallophosphoesterase [Oceanihabitans sp. 2_MG-2023]